MQAPQGVFRTGESEYFKGTVRFVATGEFRAPRKGEWYLSGAIIEAYRAPNDLSTLYWIARTV